MAEAQVFFKGLGMSILVAVSNEQLARLYWFVTDRVGLYAIMFTHDVFSTYSKSTQLLLKHLGYLPVTFIHIIVPAVAIGLLIKKIRERDAEA